MKGNFEPNIGEILVGLSPFIATLEEGNNASVLKKIWKPTMTPASKWYQRHDQRPFTQCVKNMGSIKTLVLILCVKFGEISK